MVRLLYLLPLLLVAAVLAQPAPRKISAVIVEYSDERAELGKKLFSDPILSENGKVSCSTCHAPEHAFASKGKPPSLKGGTLEIDSPSLINVALGNRFFRDGRSPSLEDQVIGPITNPAEMGSSMRLVLQRLNDNDDYSKAFAKVFKAEPITQEQLTKCIADFERTIVSKNRKLAAYLKASPESTMTESEIRGFNIFRGEGHCYKCHSGDTFTDYRFHNTGVSMKRNVVIRAGVGKITNNPDDVGKWKTPGLIGISRSAPYMHNGEFETLEEVINYYDRGCNPNTNLDREIKPLRLTPDERKDLLAFLKML